LLYQGHWSGIPRLTCKNGRPAPPPEPAGVPGIAPLPPGLPHPVTGCPPYRMACTVGSQ